MSIVWGDVGDNRRDPLSFIYNCSMEANPILVDINVCVHCLVQT